MKLVLFKAKFSTDDITSTLADTEFYIIVDGRPKIVWQGLVDIEEKLKDTN